MSEKKWSNLTLLWAHLPLIGPHVWPWPLPPLTSMLSSYEFFSSKLFSHHKSLLRPLPPPGTHRIGILAHRDRQTYRQKAMHKSPPCINRHWAHYKIKHKRLFHEADCKRVIILTTCIHAYILVLLLCSASWALISTTSWSTCRRMLPNLPSPPLDKKVGKIIRDGRKRRSCSP